MIVYQWGVLISWVIFGLLIWGGVTYQYGILAFCLGWMPGAILGFLLALCWPVLVVGAVALGMLAVRMQAVGHW